jgi:hypothetical protein
MKFLIFACSLMFLSVDNFAKNPVLLKVAHSKSKKIITYFYKTTDGSYQLNYIQLKDGTHLKVVKKGKTLLHLRAKKRDVFIKSRGKFVVLTSNRQKGISREIQALLTEQSYDQQSFNGGSLYGSFSGGFDAGIQSALDGGIGSNSSDCEQTQPCTCPDGKSITVKCSCGLVISCETKTVRVCDTNDAGDEENCREVSNCVGRCDG